MSLMDMLNASKIKNENIQLKLQINSLTSKLEELGYTEYAQTKEAIEKMNSEIADDNIIISQLKQEISSLSVELEKTDKQFKTAKTKLQKTKEIYNSIDYAINNFLYYVPNTETLKISTDDQNYIEDLLPSVILKLHCMDIKDLKKAFRDNNKQIETLLSLYSARYTTKSNKAIYQLVVIALRAELQNILTNLKYEKLDIAVEDVKKVTSKYLAIAGEGNQTIAGTLTKFIGEIEYLFINAVKIEYNYYVKKEQARQEQLAIREQMRQESEERKALEIERKKVEKEEEKYKQEILKLEEQSQSANDDEKEKLKARVLELQALLSDVVIKKEEISNLQNGKAGNVYVISNLGSFGDNVFKIGMTRRLDPQDRVDELGSASVPFRFDVHSFIFSENAVELENKLHQSMNTKRVNKVNLRKEFFYSTIDELEKLIYELDPTAEFNKTMIAEEFKQSLSSEEIYTSNENIFDSDEDE